MQITPVQHHPLWQ